MIVRGEEELKAFREEHLTGTNLLAQLSRSNGCMVAALALGAGKSTAADSLIEKALGSKAYDLVIFLAPTHAIIRERRLVLLPDDYIKSTVIRPRPAEDCGPDLNRQWKQCEKSGCGQLGRHELCRHCTKKQSCFWPDQYGKKLKGVQVVFATQAHLGRDPHFLDKIVKSTGATRPLVIIDENGFALTSYRRSICTKDVRNYLRTLQAVQPASDYAGDLQILTSASTEDLRQPDWTFPVLTGKTMLEVQEAGVKLHGKNFRDLTYTLQAFSKSSPKSREKRNGNIYYAVLPRIQQDMVLFTCSGHRKLLEYRLGRPFHSPFEGVVFEHPGTRVYNLNWRGGSRNYFKKNTPQIFDFFAPLLAKRLQEGRRVVLVCKKCFKELCATQMEERLKKLGCSEVRITTEIGDELRSASPQTIPILHYGVIGINSLEEFDCVFCLSSFYLRERTIDDLLQDDAATDHQIPLVIRASNGKNGRGAGALRARDRIYNMEGLAPEALKALEMDKVLQVIGRVRPFTKPREVFLFQHDTIDIHPIPLEFSNLAAARAHFNIPTRRESHRGTMTETILQEKQLGSTQEEIAVKLDVSVRQVQRYWHKQAT